ncbi:MAG: nucleotide exchange factor GrpE [Candidatus Brocadiales bacterium]
MVKEKKKRKGEMTAGQTEASEVQGAETAPEAETAKLSEKECSELKKKAGERDEYMNMLLRAKADLQNYQKRARKDIEIQNRLAVQDVMRAILPVLDNLSRAVKSAENSDKGSKGSLEEFLQGVELIQDQLIKVLDGFGVRPIHGQQGQAFNPELHEAVMEMEDNEFPHHTVLEEVEQGFFLDDNVLRPAKVKVSKRTVAEAGKSTAETEEPAREVGEGPKKSPGVPSGDSQGMDTGPEIGEEEPIV